MIKYPCPSQKIISHAASVAGMDAKQLINTWPQSRWPSRQLRFRTAAPSIPRPFTSVTGDTPDVRWFGRRIGIRALFDHAVSWTTSARRIGRCRINVLILRVEGITSDSVIENHQIMKIVELLLVTKVQSVVRAW